MPTFRPLDPNVNPDDFAEMYPPGMAGELIGPRQGWRQFSCEDCAIRFEEATRDCFSPSKTECPRCQGDCSVKGSMVDLTLPVDTSGNLTLPWVQCIHIL